MAILQQIIAGAAKGESEPPPPLLLDLLSTDAVRAYSMRKLRAVYSGPCARVRAAGSSDSWVDIGFSSGWFDEAAAAAVGASLDLLFYDQSGNGGHETEVGGFVEPTLGLNLLNGRAARIWGADMRSGLGNLSTLTAGEAHRVFKRASDPASANGFFWEIGTAGDPSHVPYSNGVIYDGFGTTARKTTGDLVPLMTSWGVYSAVSEAGNWTSYWNGSQHFTTATNTVGFSSSAKLVGDETYYETEFILFEAELSGGDRTTVWDSQQDDFGITF